MAGMLLSGESRLTALSSLSAAFSILPTASSSLSVEAVEIAGSGVAATAAYSVSPTTRAACHQAF